MLVADWVAQQFKSQGIRKIFVYPGGTVAPIIDACLKVGIAYECFKSEQGAGYAALAFSRLTGQPQVVLVTSGPGVTNVLSPLADAFYDSTPLILITGQISTGDLAVRKDVRQRGFQETPTVAITTPISKKSTLLVTPELALSSVKEAFELTVTGRKGPVVLDFPMNIQRSEMSESQSQNVAGKVIPKNEEPAISADTVRKVALAFQKSKRPVILLGHGALDSKKSSDFLDIADQMDALVVSSFLGLGSFPTIHKRFMGYVGHTGHLSANIAVHECDFLLVLGSRLDVRQTGTMTDQFVPQGEVAWVDLDPTEVNNPRTKINYKIHGTIESFLPLLKKELAGSTGSADPIWLSEMQKRRQAGSEDQDYSENGSLFPTSVLRPLAGLLKDMPYTLVTGVGCHQHWAARHLPLRPDSQNLLSSAGHGTMGYDLPSAIGAAMAQPERPVLCVVGDGSFLMNIQELAALNERKLNVKILIMNNRRLGIVSQFQMMNWGSDPTTGDFREVNFQAVSSAFGISADRLVSKADISSKLDWLMEGCEPKVLEVLIDPKADILPMLLANQPMNQMWTGYQK